MIATASDLVLVLVAAGFVVFAVVVAFATVVAGTPKRSNGKFDESPADRRRLLTELSRYE